MQESFNFEISHKQKTTARKPSGRLSGLLTALVTTLNLNSATTFRGLCRIHCNFKNSILERSGCSVCLHAFMKGNFTPEPSITSFRPVHAFLVFLMLVLAFTFQNDGVLADIN